MAQSSDAACANPASSCSGDTRAFDGDTRAFDGEITAESGNPGLPELTQRSQRVAWLQTFFLECLRLPLNSKDRDDALGIASRFADSAGDISDGDQEFVLNSKDADGYTILHRAVKDEYVEMVQLLVGYGKFKSYEFLHARTYRYGWTALHLAVFFQSLPMVKLLVEWYEGCDDSPPYAWDFRDDMWMTPLQYAVVSGFTGFVSHLLQMDSHVVEYQVNAMDHYRRSALHMACGHRAREMVEMLLANPFVDSNLVDCCGYTPLHWAVYAGAADVVRLLTSKATERTIRTTEEDSEGRSVLQLAIENPAIDRKVGRDIQRLLLTVAEVKDEVQGLYRDRQVFVDAANAILVGAALIAGVTFGGWLQPPQGSDLELEIFWAFNSLSFFFSLATVLAGAGAVLPMSDVYIGKAVRSIRRWLAVTSFFLLISVLLVLGAFATAGFASLRASYGNMTITTSVGSVVCVTTALFYLNRLWKIKVKDDFMMLFSDISFRMARFTFRRRPDGLHSNAWNRLWIGLSSSSRFDLDYMPNMLLEALGAGIGSETDTRALRKLCLEATYRITVANFRGATTRVPARMIHCEQAFEWLSYRMFYISISDLELGPKPRTLYREDIGERARLGEAELTLVRLFVAEHSPKGLHDWVDFPLVPCRERALEKDKDKLQFAESTEGARPRVRMAGKKPEFYRKFY